MRWRPTVSALALSATLFCAGAIAAQARDCRDEIRRQESRLSRDIDRHGYNSRQARHDRHELLEARNSCGNWGRRNWDNRRGNDHDRDRWRNDRRWNDHDRDDRWRNDRRWHDDR